MTFDRDELERNCRSAKANILTLGINPGKAQLDWHDLEELIAAARERDELLAFIETRPSIRAVDTFLSRIKGDSS